MNDDNEEMINTWTPNRYRKENQSRIIVDPRAESKKKFLEIPQNDPRIKLQNIPISQAKKRRQKGFKENTIKTHNDKAKEEKVLKQINETKDIKGISEIVSSLIKIVNSFVETTQLEIENNKKKVDIELSVLKKPIETIMNLEQK